MVWTHWYPGTAGTDTKLSGTGDHGDRFPSHLLSEISQMADYIGILADGRLQYEGWLDGAEDLENLFLEIVKGGKR